MIKKIFLILALFTTVQLFSSAEDMGSIANAPRISDIKFSGIYPFFYSELLDRMSIYPGSVYDEEKIDQQKEYLRTYIQSRGYDSVFIKIDTENISDRLKLLKFKIQKSGYFTIGNVKIEGNSVFSDIRLKKEMKIWWRSFLTGQSGRLIPDDLDKDVKKLSEFYKDHYYADAEISTEVIKDSLKRSSDIIMRIKEGPKYNIAISGNDFFSSGSLSEQIDMIKKGAGGSVSVRQIVRAVRKRYKEEGFNDVRIEWTDSLISKGSHPQNIVNISIIEGKRPLVTGISFDGNSTFKDDELSPYLNSVVRRWWSFKEFFRRDNWEDDARNVAAFYNQNGFLSAEVKTDLKYNRGKDSLNIIVSVREGIRTLIGEVKYEGSYEAAVNELSILRGGFKDKAYNPGMISDKTPHIKGLLASKGYIYARVSERAIFSPDSSKADIVFKINQNNKAETGRIFVAGNLKTKENTFKKILDMQKREPFSILSLSKGLKNLRDQKIFRSVNSFMPGMDAGKDTLDILINVEEYPSYYFQAAGGYENFSGPYLSMIAGNKNLFGKNKELSLKAEASFGEQKVTAAFTEPVFFSPNLSGMVSVYYAREDNSDLDYESRTTGLSAGMNLRWESRLQSIVQANVENKQLFESSFAGTDSNTVKNSGSIKLIQLWDVRDSFMVPRRGIYANFETVFSTGIDNNEDDFIKYSLDLKYFFTPYGPVTFAFSGKLNYLHMTYDVAEPSVDQLFYLGGSSTLRGIANDSFLKDSEGDPLGGKLSALFTFEPRFEFRKNWEIPLFLDTGLLSETAAGGEETIRLSTGTGLRYITPIGAMGILYGFPTDIKDGYLDGVFHFSLGYTF